MPESMTDYVLNGQGFGEVGEVLNNTRYSPHMMRPFLGRDGRDYLSVNTGKRDEKGNYIFEARRVTDLLWDGYKIPPHVLNATSLRKDDWVQLDRSVIMAARQRLRAWSDLAAVSSVGGFNAMGRSQYEYETMSDPGAAVVDMDGLTDGHHDAPRFQLEGIPLPITHSDFFFSERRLEISRNGGTPLDTAMAEAAGRRVAEEVEKVLIGASQYTWAHGNTSEYGTSAGKIWGYTNHPDRVTKNDITTPDGTNGATTVDDVLAMIEDAADDYYYGPFMLYHSTDWDKYMDDDYRANDSRTLRQRLRAIDQITDVRRLDFLTDTYTLLLVQMTSNVARAIIGMDITTVSWQSKGGMQNNFKVMCILVPLLTSDYNSRMGVVHGTTS